MRVIAGSAKGLRLGPVPAGVRPMSDRAREGLFSSLAAELVGARALDLFAGTGSLGIEALSRGANLAVFVERRAAAVRAVRSNLERSRLSDKAEVVTAEAVGFVTGNQPPEPAFDLVLADPPYDHPAQQVDALLAGLSAGWVVPDGTVALTRRRRSSTPVIPVDWRVAKRLEYGDTDVLVFREA